MVLWPNNYEMTTSLAMLGQIEITWRTGGWQPLGLVWNKRSRVIQWSVAFDKKEYAVRTFQDSVNQAAKIKACPVRRSCCTGNISRKLGQHVFPDDQVAFSNRLNVFRHLIDTHIFRSTTSSTNTTALLDFAAWHRCRPTKTRLPCRQAT